MLLCFGVLGRRIVVLAVFIIALSMDFASPSTPWAVECSSVTTVTVSMSAMRIAVISNVELPHGIVVPEDLAWLEVRVTVQDLRLGRCLHVGPLFVTRVNFKANRIRGRKPV